MPTQPLLFGSRGYWVSVPFIQTEGNISARELSRNKITDDVTFLACKAKPKENEQKKKTGRKCLVAVVWRGITDDLLFLLIFRLLPNCLEAVCIPLEKGRQSLLFLRIPPSPQSRSAMSLLAPFPRPPARGALSCPCWCPTGAMEESGFVLPVPPGPSIQRGNRRTRGDARCPGCPQGRRAHTGQAPGRNGGCQSQECC